MAWTLVANIQGTAGPQGPANLIIEPSEAAAVAAAAAAGVLEYVWVDVGSDPPLLYVEDGL